MAVTAFEVRLRRALAGGAAFGEVGPYEELKGQLRIAIDPAHPANARITDVALAVRNAHGLLELTAEVSVLVPVEGGRGNGRAVLDVVNRGNTVTVPNFNHATRPAFAVGADPDPPIDVGDGFLMRRGFAVVSCGWQLDLPALPGLLRLHAPEAVDDRGQPLRGLVHSQFQPYASVEHLLLSDRGHRPYAAADLEDPEAVLTVRDRPDGEPTTIPRQRWRFARVSGGVVTPDATHIHLEGGFEKGRLYQVTYTAQGAPIVGLSFAALRDCAAWLKHGTRGDGHPIPGAIRHVYAYGRSQTGRLLRTLAYEDLNLDERGREALDGFIANVAGGMRGEFNQRFGQNSKDRNNVMAHLFPFADTPQTDAATGVTDALHRRLDARESSLKCVYTNTAAEYHRGDASLIHTDPDGMHDAEPGERTRIYHFAGAEHSLGVWPPSDSQPAPADPSGAVERAQQLRGTLQYARLLRACLVHLDRWVTERVAPPPSQHPRIDDGTAVPPEALRATFDGIPGARYPRHSSRPRRLDWRTWPPRPGAAWGSRVSAVDADGNEVAGVRLPELTVPLATHTGWNLRHPDIGGEAQLLVFAGGTLPFPRTRAEREASGDPRRAIDERYASREDYLARVRRAAVALSAGGYLLAEDIEVSVARAAVMWAHFVDGPPRPEDGAVLNLQAPAGRL